jgi:hypothetical protein
LNWIQYAKDIKKRGKQKMENEPEQKKGEKGETDRTAQSGPTSPAHPLLFPEPVRALLLSH